MGLVTVQEAARRLRVSRSTLYRWSAEGRLPLVRVGPRATRVREEDLGRLEAEAPQVHGEADLQVWAEARRADLSRALEQVEGEVPAGELAAWLQDLRQVGVPVRWNPESQEFDEQ